MTAKTSEKLDGDFLTVKERIDRKKYEGSFCVFLAFFCGFKTVFVVVYEHVVLIPIDGVR